MHCLRDPQTFFSNYFFIKIGLTALFTHLIIILLQCFQFLAKQAVSKRTLSHGLHNLGFGFSPLQWEQPSLALVISGSKFQTSTEPSTPLWVHDGSTLEEVN